MLEVAEKPAYGYVQNSGVSFKNKGITVNPLCRCPSMSVLGLQRWQFFVIILLVFY
jgi:hypothetical protein